MDVRTAVADKVIYKTFVDAELRSKSCFVQHRPKNYSRKRWEEFSGGSSEGNGTGGELKAA